MNRRRLQGILRLGVAAVFAIAGILPAGAHPMGNFSINHYARLTPVPNGLAVTYVIDMAEIPTVSEKTDIDAAGSSAAYLKAKGSSLAQNLTLTVDGRAVPLAVTQSGMAFRPGAGGLQTLRMVFDLRGVCNLSAEPHQVAYHDANYPARTGWKEVVFAPSAGLRAAGISTDDRSQALTSYPNLLTVAPPQDLDAAFTIRPAGQAPTASGDTGGGAAPHPSDASAASRPGASATPRDPFTQAIATQRLTPGVMLLGLLIAFVFGAFHALSPGHGKAMVAAYLVGSRGTVKHAFTLGLIVTITHTMGVFALGFITLFASRYIVPERLYPILSAISGLAVFGVGAWLLFTRLRSFRQHRHEDPHQAHDHDHDHDHDHPHTHDHHDPMHDHDHAPDHDHDHGHDHGFGHHHHHNVPEGPITLRSLITLGVSGGIVPCPSALVVLLSAVALHRVAYGLLLITAFSVGLAGVLIAIGVIVVSAAHWFNRVPRSAFVARALPVFSAAAITCIGLVLVFRALTQGAI